ncbi:3541_t:CDS:2, partial [Scutellospora calospora]
MTSTNLNVTARPALSLSFLELNRDVIISSLSVNSNWKELNNCWVANFLRETERLDQENFVVLKAKGVPLPLPTPPRSESSPVQQLLNSEEQDYYDDSVGSFGNDASNGIGSGSDVGTGLHPPVSSEAVNNNEQDS